MKPYEFLSAACHWQWKQSNEMRATVASDKRASQTNATANVTAFGDGVCVCARERGTERVREKKKERNRIEHTITVDYCQSICARAQFYLCRSAVRRKEWIQSFTYTTLSHKKWSCALRVQFFVFLPSKRQQKLWKQLQNNTWLLRFGFFFVLVFFSE